MVVRVSVCGKLTIVFLVLFSCAIQFLIAALFVLYFLFVCVHIALCYKRFYTKHMHVCLCFMYVCAALA